MSAFLAKDTSLQNQYQVVIVIRREENIKLSKTKNLTKDEVVLGELRVPDFLVHGVGVVDVGVAAEAGRVQLGFNLFGVSIERRSNRNDHCLTGT